MNTSEIKTVPSKGYREHPGYEVGLIPLDGKIRVMFADKIIVETARAFVLRETRHAPVYYFAKSDISEDVLLPTGHSTHCPFKGDAKYWSIQTGDRTSENVVWGYPDPLPEVPELSNLVAFFWDRVDSWWLNDVQIMAPVDAAD